MDVAMLGWGFPPDVTGGLDTHVGELFEGLRAEGVTVRLVLPAEHARTARVSSRSRLARATSSRA
ncbi:MAG: hypothetical protein A07HB70_00883 [uncultured archaeon A07HB70]|nr:MAG: hypothetical protein A07HB70_00883 [uncultured archaeon A07HB70]